MWTDRGLVDLVDKYMWADRGLAEKRSWTDIRGPAVLDRLYGQRAGWTDVPEALQ